MDNADEQDSKSATDLAKRIGKRRVTSAETLMMLNTGCSYEEAKAYSKEQARIRRLAARVQEKPVGKWPAFDVVWNLDPSAFYFAFDGAEPASISSGELCVVEEVGIQAIDAALARYWRRRADEVWSVGDPNKAAKVIVRWAEGLAMTPPLLAPTTDLSQLVVVGGNHRLAVARAKGVLKIPVLCRIDQKDHVLRLLKIDAKHED